MKKLLSLLFVIVSINCFSQSTIPGYTTVNSQFYYPRPMVFNNFTGPAGNTPALFPGQTGRSGALWVDTVAGGRGLYYYALGQWIRVYDTTNVVASNSDSTLQQITDNGDSTTNKLISGDTTRGRVLHSRNALVVGDTLPFLQIMLNYGTSITQGVGTSGGPFGATKLYIYFLGKAYGFYPTNRGISATRMVAVSGSDSSMENRIYTIPTYSSTYGIITFEYGANDQTVNDTASFSAAYRKVVDSCIARGWPRNRIWIIAPPYAGTSTLPNLEKYATAALHVALSKGVVGIDAYTFTRYEGNIEFLTSDSVHYNDRGHKWGIMQAIAQNSSALSRAGSGEVNGHTYLRGIVQAGRDLLTVTPAYTSTMSTSTSLFVTENAYFNYQMFNGRTTARNNARFSMDVTSGEVGYMLWDLGTNLSTRVYGGRIRLYTANEAAATEYNSTQVLLASGTTLAYIGASSNEQFGINYNGGVTVNESGIDADFRVETDGNTNMLFADGGANRIGVGNNAPDSTLHVSGSGYYTVGLRVAGTLTGTADTTNYKPVAMSSNGTLVKMNHWIGGSGGGGTGGIDDVLAVGQALTASRVIDANGNFFQINNANGIDFTSSTAIALVGTSYGISNLPSHNSADDSMVVWNTITQTIGKRPITTGAGVTSVTAGLGMNFGTITSTGPVILDTAYAVTKGTTQVLSGSKIFTAKNYFTDEVYINTTTDNGAYQLQMGAGTVFMPYNGTYMWANANNYITVQSPGNGFWVNANSLAIYGGSTSNPSINLTSTNIVLNENGVAQNVRIESDTDANNFFSDGTNNRVGIGTASPTAKFDINSDKFRLRTAKTPASASDTGDAGDICWDADFVYICVATNTWKRVAIATW